MEAQKDKAITCDDFDVSPAGEARTTLTGTDVRWVAKGYWERYFEWKMVPGCLRWMIGTFSSVVLLLILGLISSSVYTDSYTPLSVLMVLAAVATGVFALLWLYQYRAAKEEFIDISVSNWERSGELPSFDSVIRYTRKHSRREMWES